MGFVAKLSDWLLPLDEDVARASGLVLRQGVAGLDDVRELRHPDHERAQMRKRLQRSLRLPVENQPGNCFFLSLIPFNITCCQTRRIGKYIGFLHSAEGGKQTLSYN